MTLAVTGWFALLLLPLVALGGWLLRRVGRGPLAIRMRPHYVLGYAALALALVHLSSAMGSMRGVNAVGLWFATLAVAALALQTLLGTNLQSPGLYRLPLRRWHVSIFAVALLLAIGHVAYSAPWSPVAQNP